MALHETIPSCEIPVYDADARRSTIISSALRLAMKYEIDGRPIDDEKRAKFLEYAAYCYLGGMLPQEQSDYVSTRFGVELRTPSLGVQENNLPIGVVDYRINPNVVEDDLRALYIMVGEEMLNSGGAGHGVNSAA